MPSSASVDVPGREMARLVDAVQPAGVHEVVFEAGARPSRLYVYRLEAGSYTAMRTMLLAR